MALSTSWTTIDSATIASNYTFILQARLVSQSTNSNSSVVATRIIWSFPNDYYSYSSSSTSYTLTGASGGDAGYVSYSGESGECFTGQTTVSHNTDGSKTITVSGSIDFGGLGTSTGTMSGSVALPTINRISGITCSSTDVYPYGNTYTFTITRYVSSYTHTIRYVFGALNGTIASGVGTSTTWTPPRTLLSAIPNQSSNSNLRVYCDTYNGGTLIGTSYIDLTVKTSSDESSPQITVATVTETSAYSITDAQTVALLSQKTVTVTANTQDYSSLVIIRVTCGSTTQSYVPSGTVTSATATFSLTNLTDGDYVIAVTDGRGYTTSTTVNTTYYPYILPTITGVAIDRPSPTDDYGVLTMSGACYYGTVGSTSNALTITYEYNETGSQTTVTGVTTITPTYTGTGATTYKVTSLTLGDTFSYTKGYDVTFTVTDTMGASVTGSAHVLLGIPVFNWGETHFDVNGEFHVHTPADRANPLRISSSTIIPNVKTAVVYNAEVSISGTSYTELTLTMPADFGTSLGCQIARAYPVSTWGTGGAQVTMVLDNTMLTNTGKVWLHAGSTQNYQISIILVYISNANNY